MSPILVVVLIIVVGSLLVLLAGLADRRSAQRITHAEQSCVQARTHVRIEPAEPSQVPDYITADQLLKDSPPSVQLSAEEEGQLADQLKSSRATKIDCRLASTTLATHTKDRAILDDPRVLVCEGHIATLRELLPLMGAASAADQGLVIACRTIEAEVLETIIANKLSAMLQICVLSGDDSALDALAEAARSPVASTEDRRSGSVRLDYLGQPARIVASPSESWSISQG